MKELYEYTTEELLEEIRRRISGNYSQPVIFPQEYYICSRCGNHFIGTHICMATTSSAGN